MLCHLLFQGTTIKLQGKTIIYTHFFYFCVKNLLVYFLLSRVLYFWHF